MKKVLVTGGAGAIGSRLVSKLCSNYDVLVLDDLSSGYFDNLEGLGVRFWRGSVTDDEILKEVFAERPSIICHLAANFANQNSVDYPQKDLLVNGMGTLKMLQYAHEIDVERFIYSSSSCVYGNNGGLLSEKTCSHSLDTPYAITKYLGEQYVNFFYMHHGTPTVILRFFNSYGPGEYPGKYRNVIPNFMYNVLKGLPIKITGQGTETRDFTFVDDTIQAILLAMSHKEAIGKTFNTGTGIETSIKELIEAVQETCDRRVPTEYVPPRNWDTVKRRCSDISFARDTFGYSPTTDLRRGLRKTYDWFLKNKVTSRYI